MELHAPAGVQGARGVSLQVSGGGQGKQGLRGWGGGCGRARNRVTALRVRTGPTKTKEKPARLGGKGSRLNCRPGEDSGR
eukprot:752597-Hanusia_phi.AAC.3